MEHESEKSWTTCDICKEVLNPSILSEKTYGTNVAENTKTYSNGVHISRSDGSWDRVYLDICAACWTGLVKSILKLRGKKKIGGIPGWIVRKQKETYWGCEFCNSGPFLIREPEKPPVFNGHLACKKCMKILKRAKDLSS